MPEAPRITVAELKHRMGAGEEFTIIDTRNPHAWAESDVTIPGAVRIPLDELGRHLPQIPKAKPIVAYCT